MPPDLDGNTVEGVEAVPEMQQGQSTAGTGPHENVASTPGKELSSMVHESLPDGDNVDAIEFSAKKFMEKGHDSASDSASSSDSEQPINIDKPLGLVDDFQQLDDIIAVFANRHHLSSEVHILQRGARVEKDQQKAFSNPDFPEQEREALEGEKEVGFWGQSKALKSSRLQEILPKHWKLEHVANEAPVVIVVGTLAGMCQGWSQSILNGTAPLIASYLGLHIRMDDRLRNNRDLWVFGVLLAAMPLAAGVLRLIAESLPRYILQANIPSEWFHQLVLGRRGAIATSSVITIVATVGAAASKTTAQLIGCRILWGFSLGAKASCVAPYLSEISPSHLRGALTSHWQIADAAGGSLNLTQGQRITLIEAFRYLGIFFGFVSWLAVDRSNISAEAKFRILTLTLLIPAVPLLIVAYLVPDSQTFLVKKPDYPAAFKAASQLRNNAILASRDITASHFQMEAEGELMRQRKRVKDAQNKKAAIGVSAPDVTPNRAEDSGRGQHPKHPPPPETKPLTHRLRGPPGVCPSLPQTPRGVNAVECVHSYHMTQTSYFDRLWQLFDDARCRCALICSSCAMVTQGFLCGINVLAFFSSVAFANANFSPNLATGFAVGFGVINYILPFMALIMFILATLSLIPETNAARAPLIVVFALLFVAVYSPTVGPSPSALSAEVFPAVIREVGMAVSVSVNMISLGLLILVFPWLSSAMHGYTASLCLFTVLNLVGFALCFLLRPDTKDRSLVIHL
ncbi:MAG: hypothetical protein M1839_000006 [Geoglossum umbratile]|nr:MAG: hypothetical protein M1839_000006 [Geoglossum umbratile]